jgi:2-polyprenyl-3-methyl-5-hydroxy-6-metoxy-1,4-benzoquinol methylase
MNREFYEKYHRTGAGSGGFVQTKTVPLNNFEKAKFVQQFLHGKILDAGCGGGFDVNYFAERGHDIEGCDISETAVENAKEKYPKINFSLHNFEKSPFNRKFDTVLCIDVIEHLFYYKEFLRNIHSSLNKEGTLIISTPNIFGFKSWLRILLKDGSVFGVTTADDSHIRFFSCGTMKQVLEESAFKVKLIKTFSQRRIKAPGCWGGSMVSVAIKK